MDGCHSDEMGHPGMWQMPRRGSRGFCSGFSFHFPSVTAARSCAGACPSELIPPLCPFAAICLSRISKLSSPSQVPAVISQLPVAKCNFLSSISFRKKICLLPSDVSGTADRYSPGSHAILWINQFIN